MEILFPHISCIVNAGAEGGDDERQQAIDEGYGNIYIIQGKEVFLERRLPAGRDGLQRFVRVKVDAIPGRNIKDYLEAPREYKEAMSFLPDGKIPHEMFLKVKKFFKDVIASKGTSVEAMIWIMWNEEVGYFLHVPRQAVSGASATYYWDDLPPKSIIIVDIHSHANFGAFFSGTDNADDNNTIRYSGVIGHNTSPEQSTIWRFNCMKNKYEMKFEDIFQKDIEVETDPTWLDKVEMRTYTPPALTKQERKEYRRQGGTVVAGGHEYAYSSQPPGPNNPDSVWDSKTHRWTFKGGPANAEFSRHSFHDTVSVKKAEPSPTSAPEHGTATNSNGARESANQAARNERPGNPQLSFGNGFDDLDEDQGWDDLSSYFAAGNFDRQKEVMDRMERDADPVEGKDGHVKHASSFPANPFSYGRTDPSEPTDEEIEAGSVGRVRFEPEEDEGQPVGASPITITDSGIDFHVPEHDISPEFDALASNHGVNAAIAACVISKAAEELVSSPKMLRQSLQELFQVVDEEDKLRTFRALAEQLNNRDRDLLATQGL